MVREQSRGGDELLNHLFLVLQPYVVRCLRVVRLVSQSIFVCIVVVDRWRGTYCVKNRGALYCQGIEGQFCELWEGAIQLQTDVLPANSA